MSRLIIIGAGGHGAVVAEAASANGTYNEILFIDDGGVAGDVVGFPIIGVLADITENLREDDALFIAIGDNRRRLELLEFKTLRKANFGTIIHPKACLSPTAQVAMGSTFLAGAIVNARTSLGRGCIVNTGATVDHDCQIADAVHISPGANLAGHVTVGVRSWIGIGASVREGVRIGRDSIIGAGSAVIADIPSNVVAVGVPARIQKKN